MLTRLGLEADLREASLFEMPFEDDAFDGLVCLSVLEHITELDAALTEFRRVLVADGIAVLGSRAEPGHRLVLPCQLQPEEIHPSGHRDVLAAARAHAGFVVERELTFPRHAPLDLAGYVGCRCRAV